MTGQRSITAGGVRLVAGVHAVVCGAPAGRAGGPLAAHERGGGTGSRVGVRDVNAWATLCTAVRSKSRSPRAGIGGRADRRWCRLVGRWMRPPRVRARRVRGRRSDRRRLPVSPRDPGPGVGGGGSRRRGHPDSFGRRCRGDGRGGGAGRTTATVWTPSGRSGAARLRRKRRRTMRPKPGSSTNV